MSHQDIFSDGAGGMILHNVMIKCVAAGSVLKLPVLFFDYKTRARLILRKFKIQSGHDSALLWIYKQRSR